MPFNEDTTRRILSSPAPQVKKPPLPAKYVPPAPRTSNIPEDVALPPAIQTGMGEPPRTPGGGSVGGDGTRGWGGGGTPIGRPGSGGTYMPTPRPPLAPPPVDPGEGGGGGWGGGSGGGGGEEKDEKITWSETYKDKNAPSWWRGFTPSKLDATSEYLALMNAMIPYLSPEDQVAVAQNLARQYPGVEEGSYPFAAYTNVSAEGAPKGELPTNFEALWLSSQRGQNVVSALGNMASSMGKSEKDFGPGYKFLTQVAGALTQYGGGGLNDRMTRQDYQDYLNMLDPLVAETEGNALAAYGPLAQYFAKPNFSAGTLMPVAKDENGNFRFGTGYNANFS